jgi:hypothetical protein
MLIFLTLLKKLLILKKSIKTIEKLKNLTLPRFWDDIFLGIFNVMPGYLSLYFARSAQKKHKGHEDLFR